MVEAYDYCKAEITGNTHNKKYLNESNQGNDGKDTQKETND